MEQYIRKTFAHGFTLDSTWTRRIRRVGTDGIIRVIRCFVRVVVDDAMTKVTIAKYTVADVSMRGLDFPEWRWRFNRGVAGELFRLAWPPAGEGFSSDRACVVVASFIVKVIAGGRAEHVTGRQRRSGPRALSVRESADKNKNTVWRICAKTVSAA